jgi:hypothetical protein
MPYVFKTLKTSLNIPHSLILAESILVIHELAAAGLRSSALQGTQKNIMLHNCLVRWSLFCTLTPPIYATSQLGSYAIFFKTLNNTKSQIALCNIYFFFLVFVPYIVKVKQ